MHLLCHIFCGLERYWYLYSSWIFHLKGLRVVIVEMCGDHTKSYKTCLSFSFYVCRGRKRFVSEGDGGRIKSHDFVWGQFRELSSNVTSAVRPTSCVFHLFVAAQASVCSTCWMTLVIGQTINVFHEYSWWPLLFWIVVWQHTGKKLRKLNKCGSSEFKALQFPLFELRCLSVFCVYDLISCPFLHLLHDRYKSAYVCTYWGMLWISSGWMREQSVSVFWEQLQKLLFLLLWF